jgi:MFS family permease
MSAAGIPTTEVRGPDAGPTGGAAAPAWPPLARQRLLAIAVTGFLLSFAYVAAEVVLPLWATHDLGLDAAAWANVRSLRFAGVLLGVILLGAVSDRFGQRRSAVWTLLGAGGVTALFWLNSRLVLWALMPVFGTLLSTVMINLNTLTQRVSLARQGVANSVYRGVGAAAGIGAPVAATWLAVAWGGYPAVFLALGALLGVAGVILLAYPLDEPVAPLGHPRVEALRLWQSYAGALRQKPLMRFINLSQLWYNSQACVGAFAAIRLTRELGMSDRAFGLLSTAGGVVTFALIAGTAWHLDHLSLRRVHLVAGMVAAGGTLLMGASDTVLLTSAGMLVAAPVSALLIAPSSMWVSRAAGSATQVSAFAVHKVVSALCLSLAMFLLGLLESWLGIRMTLLLGGGVGLVAACGFMLLLEPPHASRGAPSEATAP